jgi:hypothetical protein
MNTPFQVHRALQYAWGAHHIGGSRRETSVCELVLLISVSCFGLSTTDRLTTRREREPVDGVDEIGGGQINHTLLGRKQVCGCL